MIDLDEFLGSFCLFSVTSMYNVIVSTRIATYIHVYIHIFTQIRYVYEFPCVLWATLVNCASKFSCFVNNASRRRCDTALVNERSDNANINRLCCRRSFLCVLLPLLFPLVSPVHHAGHRDYYNSSLLLLFKPS